MSRVQMHPPPAHAGGQMPSRHEQNKEEPKYTVMMEQVTQPKKRLVSKNSFKIQPPKGYTFIALSEPAVTDKCKDLSRQAGAPIHIVSTSKGGQRSTELSQQVGRIGHHFASDIVAKALSQLGLDMDAAGRLRVQFEKARKSFGTEAARKDQKGTRVGEGITDPAKLKKEQEKLYGESRTMLKTLFPGMPEKDVKAVVKHAFTINKDRIGSSAEVSLDRRVHLAVMAHIRHSYTDYDKLLKQVPYQTARSIVEKNTLTKMIEWRGEDDKDDDGAVEDILREVIVINDDDDDDPQSPISADDDLEFSSEQIPADQIDTSIRMTGPMDRDYLRYAYGRRAPTRMHDQQTDRERLQREDAIRSQRWREARELVRRPDATRIYPPPPNYASDLAPGERRELIPVQQVEQARRQEPEHQRMLVQESVGRERELILVRPAHGHVNELQQPRTFDAGYASGHSAQVDLRRYAPSAAYPSATEEYRPGPRRVLTPPRSGEVVHPSIEAPNRREIIEIDQTPPRRNGGEIPERRQAQATNDHRWQEIPELRSVQHQDGILGKRQRPESTHNHSPVKAQRIEDYTAPHGTPHSQVITLTEAERAPHMAYHNTGASPARPMPTAPSAHSSEEQRRYAYSARRLSDQVRYNTNTEFVRLEPQRREVLPARVRFVPVHHGPGPQVPPSRQIDVYGSRPGNGAPHQPPHGSRDQPIPRNDTNERAYQQNDYQPAHRPPVVIYERRGHPDSRAMAGPVSPRDGGFQRQEPQRVENRFHYEQRPVEGQVARHAHSRSDSDRHAFEHSRSGMQDLRIEDRHHALPDAFDSHGRRIVILDAPR